MEDEIWIRSNVVGVRRLKIGILISEMDMDWPTSKDGLLQKPKLSMGFLPQ